LDVTSYAEVALNPRRADQAHPAFAKLFLETEHLAPDAALLCRRRPPARDQEPAWALHVLASAEESSAIQPGDFEFETDRARFLGRGRSAQNPVALETRAPLSSTVGPVLDPIFSLRRRTRLSPGASTVLAFTTAVPRNRDKALALAIRFKYLGAVDRAFDAAASSVPARLAELKLTTDDAELFQRLAAHVVFTTPSLR
jgi:cyclic beta-1,2-glucan synthetase